MSGFATVTLMGRVTKDVSPRQVDTRKGEMTVHDLSIAVNSFVSGKEVGTFFSSTIWPGRFDGMLPFLKKGKAVILSGDFYMATFRSESGAWESRLNVELSSLKFTLSDSKNLVLAREREQKKESEKKEDEHQKILNEIYDSDDESDLQESTPGSKRPRTD
eukprot:NODE_388_length_8234_cov_1.030731.p4 type:complete len:161 gc:universal NODE_388_length_8234_cov_1.030731:5091-5573(+)